MPGRPPGRHSLSDRFATDLVTKAGVRRGELVVDLGAGGGPIALAAARAGARVVAVELDEAALRRLGRRAADLDVRVLRGDLRRLRLPTEPHRVVANPPFSLTAPLLRQLLRTPSLRRADLVLADGAVRGWVRGDEARAAGPWWDVRRGRRVPRHAFTPPPAVDARILTIERRATPLLPPSARRTHHEVVRRRGPARHALEGLLTERQVVAVARSAGFDRDTPLDALTAAQWAAVTQMVVRASGPKGARGAR